MRADSGVARPATTAGTRPEYRLVGWRLTRVTEPLAGRLWGRRAHWRNTNTWL